MAVNIRDGELNKNDMTHDELYFTKYLHVHSQKKTLSHTQVNKQRQQQLRVQRAMNNNYSEKR